jgi:hypothetical protein
MDSCYLYEIEPMVDKEWIQSNIKIECTSERDVRWLINWLGKDITDPDFIRRKVFLNSDYFQKKESKPFFTIEESNDLLLDQPDLCFISRLSSTQPGEVTIQHYDSIFNQSICKRFDCETFMSTDPFSNKIHINFYIQSIFLRKGKSIPKINYYAVVVPYLTIKPNR